MYFTSYKVFGKKLMYSKDKKDAPCEFLSNACFAGLFHMAEAREKLEKVSIFLYKDINNDETKTANRGLLDHDTVIDFDKLPWFFEKTEKIFGIPSIEPITEEDGKPSFLLANHDGYKVTFDISERSIVYPKILCTCFQN